MKKITLALCAAALALCSVSGLAAHKKQNDSIGFAKKSIPKNASSINKVITLKLKLYAKKLSKGKYAGKMAYYASITNDQNNKIYNVKLAHKFVDYLGIK